ncbi:MAG: transglutaminase domain-containing protein [Thermoleophilaceae bacterium]|nr:transglutaminase domain-containing protein [Thermoleophilaceae bacterium]
MSGLLARPATAPADPSSAPSARAESREWDPFVVRLTVFGALAAYGAAHWAMLVTDAHGGRTLLVVLLAVGGGAVMGALDRASLPRPAVHALAVVVALATLALGLMAAGLPARLLAPGGFAELFDGLDRGLAGVESVEWPYEGPDEWIRLTILLGAPLFLAIAASVTFWPARRAAPGLRLAGLVVLLLLYGTAVTEHDPGRPLLRGLGLLLLVAAWLWLPRLPRREAGVGAAVVAGAGVLSLPFAAALNADQPWWDYRAWDWFGGGKSITFHWTHEYGPLDWPRDGTTLLNVKSDRPHYWKTQVLDGFDGFRWVPTMDNRQDDPSLDLPDRSERRGGPGWDNFEWNPDWAEEIQVTVRSLASNLVVTAGLAYDLDDVDAHLLSDGTSLTLGDPLEKGDNYTVRTYAPNPTRAQMRDAVQQYPGRFVRATAIVLPPPGASAIEGVGRQGDIVRGLTESEGTLVHAGLRGDPLSGSPRAEERFRDSVYADTYSLARRLTDDEPNVYEAVKAIERYLQEEYVYRERVPSADVPLEDFLFRERAGYCQQFSGAMALMLRMIGIPARVAAGFSPGSFNRDTGEYRVRDLDAHSWVEVYFNGIGWVPFDPTPPIAATDSRAGEIATGRAGVAAGAVRNQGGSSPAPERAAGGRGGGGDGGGPGWLLALLAVPVLAVGAGALVVALRMRRLRGLTASELAEAQLRELRRALERLGWKVPAGTTLLDLERRLRRAAGPASAAYAGGLRAHRYDPRAPDAPGASERRAMRRELSARRRLRDRLRALLAMPPGGPRL